MAVKVNNTANIRKAQRWSEKDDAALCFMLKKKMKDVNVALRQADTPYARARLKDQKKHYKEMLVKVERGVYNGDIIFSELQAAAVLRNERAVAGAQYATAAGGRAYNSSYTDMDFDYESAFRKKRYYGFALPIVLIILSIAFLGIFLLGAFMGNDAFQSIENSTGIALDGFMILQLTPESDIIVANDGNWPRGIYADKKKAYKDGQLYEANGDTPETVRLNADLGMIGIYISPFDIIKAWFRTPMLEKTRLDFLEDNSKFQGRSYYYIYFLSDNRAEALTVAKDEDGNFDFSVIMRFIGVYGMIYLLVVLFILSIVNLAINIGRLFSYTSRKLHILSLVMLILSFILVLAPALASVEGTDLGASLSSCFSYLTDSKGFFKETESLVGIGIPLIIPLAVCVVMLIVPKLFRNRLKKMPTYVPKGNKNRNVYNDPYVMSEEGLKRLR